MYRRGRKIRSLDALAKALLRGDYVFHRGKVMHPGFMISMQFNYVLHTLRSGFICKAVRNQ